MNTILRFIYRRFSSKFSDFLVVDYLERVPTKVKDDAIQVLYEQKHKLQRLNDFMAFQLHQRLRFDHKNSEKYQGMLVQLKVMDALVRSQPAPEEIKKEVKKKDGIDWNNAIEKASDFATKMTKDKSNSQ